MHPPTSRRIEKISTVGNIISVRLVVHKCTSKNENYGTSLHLSLFKEANFSENFCLFSKGGGHLQARIQAGGVGPVPFSPTKKLKKIQ